MPIDILLRRYAGMAPDPSDEVDLTMVTMVFDALDHGSLARWWSDTPGIVARPGAASNRAAISGRPAG